MWLPHGYSLVLVSLLSSALALPVAEKPLLRVKRAEEMMVGNQQNSARVKKTDPSMHILGDDKAVIDKHASVEAKSEPLPQSTESNDVNTDTGDVKPEPDDVDTIIEDVKAGLEPANIENDLATLQGQKEEVLLDNLQSENGDDSEDLTEDEVKELEQQNQVPVAEEMRDETEPEVEPQNEDTDPSWYDYFNFDNYYPKYFVGDGERQKRSANAKMPMTAENMMAAGPQRFKRDLTEDEIREWLAEEASEPYYGEEKEAALVPFEEEPLSRNEEALLERILEAEALDELEKDVIEAEEPVLYPAQEQDIVDLDQEEQAKMALLRYLYETLPEDVENEVQQELYQPEVEEFEDDIEYEPIVYEGVPGIFIPVKRQYLSMVPGLRKRGSDFYPYQYEPSSAGRWGALIGQTNEEKRNAEAYERLYRMAEALNRDDGDWYQRRRR